ncbi:sensor domain-containing diguanylate cyclase [Kineobactrum salinum]|uniref:diguanylate cyclase n=1 Tax=Kineobactrum salinum TaxID=2708301 RepID=A0A6C0TYC1_9GAMM|nr:diguanylate cyclase [Kineobactrum salinum]QIB64638.1 diguanylate cyclase [Kineobactrum salinum]
MMFAPAMAGPPIPVLQLDSAGDEAPLRHLVHIVDAEGELDIGAIAANPEQLDWVAGTGETPSMGIIPDPVWFALRLDSSGDSRRLLAVSYPPLDHVDVYLLRQGRVLQHFVSGDQLPFESRTIGSRDFVFPLDFAAGAEYLILMRVQTTGALQLPVTLWDPDRFIEHTQHELVLQVLFIGILLALAAYNMLLYFAVRDRAYLWYVAYLVSYLLAQATLQGLGFQYLWPAAPAFNHFALPFFFAASFAAVGFFTHRFLNVKHYSEVWSALVLAMAWAGVTIIAMSLVLPYGLTLSIMIVATSIGSVLLFFCGCYLWWKGSALAPFYVVAWTLFLTGNLQYNLSKAGIVPYNAIYEYAPQFGTVLQVLLFSFALAYRINLERRQREQAQEQALVIQRQANEELELRVEERTNELKAAYDKVKQFSQLDGLTQLKNRAYFDQALETEWSRHTRDTVSIAVVMIDADNFKDINDMLGHLCGDDCLRYLAGVCSDKVHRAGDIVARYGGEEFVVLLPATELEGAAAVAEEIRSEIAAAPYQWNGQPVPLTVSIGVAACIPDRQQALEWLLRHADEALYAAKAAGRNRTMIYRPSGCYDECQSCPEKPEFP